MSLALDHPGTYSPTCVGCVLTLGMHHRVAVVADEIGVGHENLVALLVAEDLGGLFPGHPADRFIRGAVADHVAAVYGEDSPPLDPGCR